MKQISMSMTGYFDKGKKTRREQFLAEMDQVVPWRRLYALIEPHYPKGSAAGGRPPLPLERMFRIYCLQQWYNLSDPGAEEALYDSITMRHAPSSTKNEKNKRDPQRGAKHRPLTKAQRLRNRRLSRVRAVVEHPFLAVKRLWGHAKVRYRGIAKNLAQMNTLFGLANLYRVRYRYYCTQHLP